MNDATSRSPNSGHAPPPEPLAALGRLLWHTDPSDPSDPSDPADPADPADAAFPAGSGARVLTLREPVPAGYRVTERYQAVPSLRRPGFLLPLDLPAGARARVLREYNDLRYVLRRTARSVLALGVGAGLVRPRRSQLVRIAVPEGPWSGTTLRSLTADALGLDAEDLVLATSVRPSAGGMRPTVMVADRAGRPVVFLKVADSPLHHERLTREHDALETLAQSPVPGLLAPAPLLLRRWEHRLILGVAPLPPDVRRLHLEDAGATWEALDRLQDHQPTQVAPLSGSVWDQDTRARIHAVDQPYRDRLEAQLGRLLPRHPEVLFVRRHGDWSPWNLARSGDRLVAWDWEFSQALAPQGLDRLSWHFLLQTSYRGVPVEEAARSLVQRAASTRGLPEETVELFLLDMAVRRAEEVRDHDAESGDVATRLLGVLDGL